MMTEELDEQIARSVDATPELLPFLPELLADIWALGASAE
ncbi:MAG: class I SAM-dependent methyltransferase, partial [Planctomycetes bacterium]|nr:class I SAM-dependent methyltransferase [Planctomycetota bacterium]